MVKILTKDNDEIELILPKTEHPKVLVIGVTHGDEPQGNFLIKKYLRETPETKLMFIPTLNPGGLRLNQRTNIRGVDLNRNFPTENWQDSPKNEFWGGEAPASEIETLFVINTIENFKPKLILTLHAPYKVVNYDGDAEIYAKEISNITGYPVQEDIGYPTPGSFGTYAGIEKGIPTITLELDEECELETLVNPIFKVFNYLETLIL